MAETKQFPLSIVIRGVDRVTGVLGKVQGAIDKVGERVAAVSKRSGLTALRGSVGQLGVAFRSLGERSGLPVLRASLMRVREALHRTGEAMHTLVEWGKRLALIGGVVAASGAVMFKSFLDQAGHLNDLKDQLGVNIQKFQEWAFAAKLAGVDQDALAQGVRMLNYNLGQAAAGTGIAKDVFKALGISLKDAKGHLKGAEQVLPELADKLSKIHSATLKASIAQTLMSRSGQELLPVLAGGSKGLAEMGAKARALGMVLDQKTIDAGDKLGDTLDTLHMAVQGITARIGGALTPILQKLADKLIDLAQKYGPAISKWAEGFAKRLPAHLREIRDLFVQIWHKLQPLVHGIEWMVKTFGGANVVLGALAVVVAATVLPAMVALTGAIYTMGVALLTTPVGWILLGLAAIAAAAMFVYKHWEPISRWLGDHLFAPFFDALHAVEGLVSNTWDKIKSGFSTGMSAVKSAASTGWTHVKSAFRGGVDVMKMLITKDLQLGAWLGGKIKDGAAVAAAAWEKYNPVALIQRGIQGLMDFIGNLNLGQAIRDKIAAIASYLPPWLTRKLGIADIASAGPAAPTNAAVSGAATIGRNAAAAQHGAVRVQVDFNNLPKGARVTTQRKGQPDFELNQGFALGGL